MQVALEVNPQVPAARARGIGRALDQAGIRAERSARAQTQRPLAIVAIGGALAILLLTRILQPMLIYLCQCRLRLEDTPPPIARRA
ncbi:MAG: hypothetical protein ACREPW_03865 [Candidatus Binataceae bacterium]